MTKTEQRIRNIHNLIDIYEKDLGDVLHVGEHFDTKRLPELVRKTVELIVAKVPEFSSAAALNTANYALAHVVCQARVMIDDPVYSKNHIGTNYYALTFAKSGGGKSSSTNALVGKFGIFRPALDLVDGERNKHNIHLAKEVALKELQKEDKNLRLEHVSEGDYEQYLAPLGRTTTNAKSSRGGISGILSALQQEEFGALGLTIDELGMTVKTSKLFGEVIELTTEVFDMSVAEAPAYKTVELQEESVEGVYTNLLAHTSPHIVFGTESVKETIDMMFSSAFARRSWFTFSDDDESIENDPIPASIAEADALALHRRQIETDYAVDVSEQVTKSMANLLTSHDARLLKFTPEAAQLYTRYFDYCKQRSKVAPDSSLSQLEISGRTWRIGKLAGAWTAAIGDKLIQRSTIESAIYFAEWNARYLDKFSKLISDKPYELVYEFFTKTEERHITLDSAISKGFISRITPEFRDLLEPLNSKLTGTGVVQYNQDIKSFIYEPFKIVEPEPSSSDKPGCNFAMSYTMIPEDESRVAEDAPEGLSDKDIATWVKAPREKYLGGFSSYKEKLCYQNLVNLVSRNTIFNPFQYKDGFAVKDVDKKNLIPMCRRSEYIESNTNLIVLDVDKSEVDMHTIHDYLSDYSHVISTSSNKDNKHKFRIILPINVELSGANTKQYSFIVKRIGAELLLEIDPQSAVSAQAFYGYKGAEVLVTKDQPLFDITSYLTEFAAGEEIKPTQQLVKNRSRQARKANVDKHLDNIETIFSYAILPESNWSFQLARASKHMRDEGFTKSEYKMAIDYIHNRWDEPLSPQRYQNTVIDQFLSQMASD